MVCSIHSSYWVQELQGPELGLSHEEALALFKVISADVISANEILKVLFAQIECYIHH